MIQALRASHARGALDVFAQGIRDAVSGKQTLNAIAASRDVAELVLWMRRERTEGGGASEAASPVPSRFRKRARR